MKKKIAHSSLFLMVSFVLYMFLFFVYGDIKLQNLDFAGEKLPESAYSIIEKKIVWNNKQFLKRLYIKNKESSYMTYIDEQILMRGIPNDIRYIPYVESSLQAEIVSEQGGAGIWQLTPEIAQNYEMNITGDIDERYDIKISTTVALEFLISLYDTFGSRSLAIAGYHSGEASVSNAIKNSKSENFYDIVTDSETQDYIFKILAYKYGR